MSEKKEFYIPDDVIDLRELVKTLLKYKWFIIAAVIVTAGSAFLISKFLVPKQYEATSYVIVTEPSLVADLESSIQVEPNVPDIEAITDLIQADSILREVYEIKEVEQILEDGLQFTSFKSKFQARLVGSSQLRLQVINHDPECAALIANIWADVVVDHLTSLYGTTQGAYAQLNEQLQTAQQAWGDKQQQLVAALADSQVEALESQLIQGQNVLMKIHQKIENNKLLLADLNMFGELLSTRPGDETLRFEDLITILALRQRWMGDLDKLQLEFDRESLYGSEYSTAQAQNMILVMMEIISQDNLRLEEELSIQEELLPSLKADLEQAKYYEELRRDERDLAHSAYVALSAQVEETRISLVHEDQTAKIAATADRPEAPVRPRIMLTSALSGLAALVISLVSVLLFDWFAVKPNPTGPSK